eukprot:4317291-Amphidinium_carterae.2
MSVGMRHRTWELCKALQALKHTKGGRLADCEAAWFCKVDNRQASMKCRAVQSDSSGLQCKDRDGGEVATSARLGPSSTQASALSMWWVPIHVEEALPLPIGHQDKGIVLEGTYQYTDSVAPQGLRYTKEMAKGVVQGFAKDLRKEWN